MADVLLSLITTVLLVWLGYMVGRDVERERWTAAQEKRALADEQRAYSHHRNKGSN